jgi:hypothetical protein
VAELRFRVGAIFPADNPTARYVMAVSIALGDIRTVVGLAAGDARTGAERLYLARLLEHHVRQGLRLALVAHHDRDDVRRFVSILPQEAQEAREELGRLVEGHPEAVEPLAVLDDGLLRAAMERVATTESGFSIHGTTKRADFADLVVATTLLADGGSPEARDVLVPLVSFLEHVEAAWLRPWRG